MRSIRISGLVLPCVVALVTLSGVSANAAIVTAPLVDRYYDPGLGQVIFVDSGWSATYNTAVVDISVDQVSLGGDYLLIEISKDYYLPPNPDTGQFPSILIDFVQRLPDAHTVGTIRIGDESITNLTGVPWADYHWEVLNHASAWFDVGASGTFGIQPLPHFQQQYWERRLLAPQRADALEVFDGWVRPGSSYYPGTDGSDLVIQTNLLGPLPVSFTFKQYPTPEPATMALLGLGLGALVIVRKRRA